MNDIMVYGGYIFRIGMWAIFPNHNLCPGLKRTPHARKQYTINFDRFRKNIKFSEGAPFEI